MKNKQDETPLERNASQRRYSLFNIDGMPSKPQIQRCDEHAPEGYTDDNAAIEFVRDLEAGNPNVVEMAEKLIAAVKSRTPDRGWPERSVSTSLIDKECGNQPAPLPVTIHYGGDGIYIQPEGYGDACSSDGHGTPVMLELYGGKLRLVVWSDINQENPTHVINLAGASEELRLTPTKQN